MLGLRQYGGLLSTPFRSRKPRLTAMGIRCADPATPLYPLQQAAAGRSVQFSCGLKSTEFLSALFRVLFNNKESSSETNG
jgi:hypothetical protein